MPCVRDLHGLPPDVIVLLPLHGHTPGHAGVAISAENGWHLHCGDAYMDAREMGVDPHGRFGMQFYETCTAIDRADYAHSQQRLRVLHYKHPDVIMNCAKDPGEFERLAGRAAHLPADPITPLARDPYVEKIVRKRPGETCPSRRPRAPRAGLEVVHHDAADVRSGTLRRTARRPRPRNRVPDGGTQGRDTPSHRDVQRQRHPLAPAAPAAVAREGSSPTSRACRN